MSYMTSRRDDDDFCCTDPSCGCDVSEQNTYTDGLLRYLASEAELALVFLPDGRIWAGEDAGLFELGNQLTQEREAEDISFSAEHKLWMEDQAEKTKETVLNNLTAAELTTLLAERPDQERECVLAGLKLIPKTNKKHLIFLDEDVDIAALEAMKQKEVN